MDWLKFLLNMETTCTGKETVFSTAVVYSDLQWDSDTFQRWSSIYSVALAGPDVAWEITADFSRGHDRILREVVVWKFASTSQKHHPDLGSDTSSVWNFCARSSDAILRESQLSRRECRLFSQASPISNLWKEGSTHTFVINYFCQVLAATEWVFRCPGCVIRKDNPCDLIDLPITRV